MWNVLKLIYSQQVF